MYKKLNKGIFTHQHPQAGLYKLYIPSLWSLIFSNIGLYKLLVSTSRACSMQDDQVDNANATINHLLDEVPIILNLSGSIVMHYKLWKANPFTVSVARRIFNPNTFLWVSALSQASTLLATTDYFLLLHITRLPETKLQPDIDLLSFIELGPILRQ